jgi:bis(5'-nucleosyl)-tetraphosphatase (symmetrical)
MNFSIACTATARSLNENLRGVDRLRVIVNAFTRLRYCDLEGNMDLRPKGLPGSQPPDLMPWFQVPDAAVRS